MYSQHVLVPLQVPGWAGGTGESWGEQGAPQWHECTQGPSEQAQQHCSG